MARVFQYSTFDVGHSSVSGQSLSVTPFDVWTSIPVFSDLFEGFSSNHLLYQVLGDLAKSSTIGLSMMLRTVRPSEIRSDGVDVIKHVTAAV